MLLYAVTIFLSAFLLFQVQPLIAKIILPWFGGSAAVWSAALLFFQLVLLAGYAYAHWSIRFLKARAQMLTHVTLLAVSCALLPILPSEKWKPTEAGDPTLRILLLLVATIGLPYFLLSSTSPLLQAWYVRRSGNGMPYRLFALSNFGSMLALISFPFLVEPNLTSKLQAYSWSGGYVAFALVCTMAAWVSREDRAPAGIAPETPTDPEPRPKLSELALWVSLATVASVLLVSITTHMSQNVAPIPLLWVLPLALYLITFMIAFESDRLYHRGVMFVLLAPMFYYLAKDLYQDSGNLHIRILIPVFAGGLFLCCMLCHGELARRRPAPQYLTLFYLMVSLGGAFGGIFVALIAPRVFHSNLELPLGLGACALLGAMVMWDGIKHKIGRWVFRVVLLVGVGMLLGYLARREHDDTKGFRVIARNFYGVLHVKDDLATNEDEYSERTLLHGTINHGSQILDENLQFKTTSYYGEDSGVGRAIRAVQQRGPIRVGVVGLGAGVLSNYGRAGDFYRIFEINPLVEKVAQTEFTFYPHSPADKKILMGDARLTMERLDSLQLDVLAVDAFSSDAIPVHLLTREALAVYFRHLKPDGILALHISNRYLDLEPVCARGAEFFGKTAMVVSDDGEQAPYLSASTWVLVASDNAVFGGDAFRDANIEPAKAGKGFRAWTDDYSNIFQILKLH
ncbi:MAG TPA: fused MFS/spermidine synthase [Bryobacteraceae bacterium]|nr:fused MFS/spermidine synthase [Bryobacteraceae bacterium]